MRPVNVIQSWGKVLGGKIPMLSIEITRECPLSCPGCYAYGDAHLGEGQINLRSVKDFRGDRLTAEILRLVDQHAPLQVSLVGGEPMMRHRELNDVLPELSKRGIYALVVTSGVIPVPQHWMDIPRLTIAVSVDGNPEDHDVRRKPATYERILRNIEGRRVNVHWTIVRSNVESSGYMDRYLNFWNERPEVDRIWVSVYTPQVDEQSPERLTSENRKELGHYFRSVGGKYQKLTMHDGLMRAFLEPPKSPADCLFSKLSVNYTADLKTRVEPCVFGGTPDCSECGCSMSMGMHWLGDVKVGMGVRARHLIASSLAIGRTANKILHRGEALRWNGLPPASTDGDLIQIEP